MNSCPRFGFLIVMGLRETSPCGAKWFVSEFFQETAILLSLTEDTESIGIQSPLCVTHHSDARVTNHPQKSTYVLGLTLMRWFIMIVHITGFRIP